jgi:hypothetical protein
LTFISKDRDLWRRLRFYGFGLLMGCGLVSVITKGKACQMPGTVKLEELNSKIISFSKEGICWIECIKISTDDIKLALKNGDVNYSKSEVHARPYPTYAVDGYTKTGQHLRILIANLADTSRITKILNLSSANESCHCK